MLYLKYRPQKVSEIDTASVRESLTNILSTKEIPHAFLLAGPKGTGKTSSARIIAKAINCEKRQPGSFEPCSSCFSCRTITRGISSDVYELDGASNRKIDNIRDLIATVAYTPVSSRYKVYIIDEVHMLTREAASALLKTLEEPPSHVIFILATTESEALPATIVSRCVPITFYKAGQEEIIRLLTRIAKAEKAIIPKEVLAKIAAHADSSFRDSVKLLEQAITQKALTVEKVAKMLGSAMSETLFLKLLQDKKRVEALAFLQEYGDTGGSFKILTQSLLDLLHQVLLAKNNIGKLDEDFTLTNKDIAHLMKLIVSAYDELKLSPIDSIPMEIVVVEYCERQD